MVERGWVDLNRPLVAVCGVTQGGFAEGAAHGPAGPLAMGAGGACTLAHSTTLTPPFVGDQEREKVYFTSFVAPQAPSFYPEKFFPLVLPI